MDPNQDRNKPISRCYGVWFGIVEDITDPEKLGRIKVRVPQVWTDKARIPTDHLPWAHMVHLGGGGPKHGTYHLPSVGSQVAVVFYQGDPNYPLWIGGVWGRGDTPTEVAKRAADTPGTSRHGGQVYPGSNPSGSAATAVKVHEVITPAGHKIVLDDGSASSAKHTTIESSGGHLIVLDDVSATKRIEIQSQGGHNILLSEQAGKQSIVITTAGGHEVFLDDSGSKVEVNTNGGHYLHMTDGGSIDLSSTGDINITAAGNVNISGTNINLN